MNSKKESNKTINLPDDNDIALDITQAFDDPNVLNIGKTFVEARAKRGLTQEQASKNLKVRIKLIIDFEEGKPLDLPGFAYKIGFVRSYANLVNLDTDYIVEAYKNSLEGSNGPVSYNFLEAKKEKRSILPFAGLATFLVCLISYSTWYYNSVNSMSENDKMEVSKIKNTQKIPKVLDYVKIEEQNLLPNDTPKGSNNLKVNLVASNNDQLVQKSNVVEKEEQMLLKENVSPKLEKEMKIVSEKKELKNSNEISAIANERDPGTEMVLKSIGNSWVEIEDLDGNSLVTRLMRSGETYVIPKKKGLTLSTGNAGVLSLTYGDEFISSLGKVGEVISSRPLNIEAFRKR